MAIGKPSRKEKSKIKTVKGFNEAPAGTGFESMTAGKDNYIPGERTAGIGDHGKDDSGKLSQLDHNAKGQPIKRSIMDNPNLNKETTAEPALYNEEIGIVIGYENPLDRLNAIIKRGLIDNSETLFNKGIETMIKKNQDYAGSNEAEGAMKNFKVSAEVSHIPMSKGILVRLMDKMTRIGNLIHTNNAAVKDESIFDTLQDAINYSAILYFALLIEKRDRLVKQNEDLANYEEERNG